MGDKSSCWNLDQLRSGMKEIKTGEGKDKVCGEGEYCSEFSAKYIPLMFPVS